MSDIGPRPNTATRRPPARWLARAAVAAIAIAVCTLPAAFRADAGTGAPNGHAAAAQPPTTTPGSEVSFRVVRDAEQPFPPPPPPVAKTGSDLPVFALAGGAFVLIALGTLMVVVLRGSARRRSTSP